MTDTRLQIKEAIETALIDGLSGEQPGGFIKMGLDYLKMFPVKDDEDLPAVFRGPSKGVLKAFQDIHLSGAARQV